MSENMTVEEFVDFMKKLNKPKKNQKKFSTSRYVYSVKQFNELKTYEENVLFDKLNYLRGYLEGLTEHMLHDSTKHLDLVDDIIQYTASIRDVDTYFCPKTKRLYFSPDVVDPHWVNIRERGFPIVGKNTDDCRS